MSTLSLAEKLDVIRRYAVTHGFGEGFDKSGRLVTTHPEPGYLALNSDYLWQSSAWLSMLANNSFLRAIFGDNAQLANEQLFERETDTEKINYVYWHVIQLLKSIESERTVSVHIMFEHLKQITTEANSRRIINAFRRSGLTYESAEDEFFLDGIIDAVQEAISIEDFSELLQQLDLIEPNDFGKTMFDYLKRAIMSLRSDKE